MTDDEKPAMRSALAEALHHRVDSLVLSSRARYRILAKTQSKTPATAAPWQNFAWPAAIASLLIGLLAAVQLLTPSPAHPSSHIKCVSVVYTGETTSGMSALSQTEAQKALERKLKEIVIPELNFRDASLKDAVAFLSMRAKAIDPQKQGVNILIASPSADPAVQPVLTLQLSNVSLYDALRYCSETGGFQTRIDDNAVVLTP